MKTTWPLLFALGLLLPWATASRAGLGLLTSASSDAPGVEEANGIILHLGAIIDGPQANAGAGSGSPASGTASVEVDTTTNLLSWNISWGGLLGNETVMHFHGPALPNQNAGVQVDFGSISGTGSPSIGSTPITAGQAADLQNGLWYINIHTDQYPAGEIRGQVLAVPEPATGLLLAVGLLAVVRARRGR